MDRLGQWRGKQWRSVSLFGSGSLSYFGWLMGWRAGGEILPSRLSNCWCSLVYFCCFVPCYCWMVHFDIFKIKQACRMKKYFDVLLYQIYVLTVTYLNFTNQAFEGFYLHVYLLFLWLKICLGWMVLSEILHVWWGWLLLYSSKSSTSVCHIKTPLNDLKVSVQVAQTEETCVTL